MAWKAFVIISLLAVAVAGVATAHNATEAQNARILAEFQMPEMLKDLIRMEVAKDCENANSVDKTEQASEAVIQFCDCAFRLVAEDMFSLEKFGTAIQEKKVALFWKTTCDKSALFRKCLTGFVAGYSPCAQKDLMKSIAVLTMDLESVLDFTCFNEGERLTKITSKATFLCLNKEHDSLRECQKRVQDASMSTYMNAVKNISSEQVCKKVDEVTTCVADVVRKCENSADISAFLEEFSKHFQKTSGSCQVDQEHE